VLHDAAADDHIHLKPLPLPMGQCESHRLA
jgi:hypothetical protein